MREYAKKMQDNGYGVNRAKSFIHKTKLHLGKLLLGQEDEETLFVVSLISKIKSATP